MAWPLGTAQRWLQFHLYGGVLAALFVALHVGFRGPGGGMGWWLIGLTVVGDGVGTGGRRAAEVRARRCWPTSCASKRFTSASPSSPAACRKKRIRSSPPVPILMQRFYADSVRADLERLTPSWGYLAGFRAELARRVAPFDGLAAFLSEPDRVRLANLQAIVTEKLELEVQYSLQRLLKHWVMFHVVPCMLLLALLTVHIVSVIASDVDTPRDVPSGTPARAPGYVRPADRHRPLRWALGLAAAVLVVFAALFAAGRRGVASPGPVSAAHAAIGIALRRVPRGRTNAAPANGRGAPPSTGLRAAGPALRALPRSGGVGSSRTRRRTCSVGPAARRRCMRGIGWRAPACHVEHRGRAGLARAVDDRTCVSCHQICVAVRPSGIRRGQGRRRDRDRPEVHARSPSRRSAEGRRPTL